MPLVTVKVSNNSPNPGPISGGAPDAAAPSEAARAGGGSALANQQRSAAGARPTGAPQTDPAGDRARAAAAGTATAGRPGAAPHPATKARRGVDAAPNDGYEARSAQLAPTAAKSAPAPTAGAAAAMAQPRGLHTGVPARTQAAPRPLGAQGTRRPGGQASARSSRSSGQAGEGAVAGAGERKARSDEDDPARSSTSADVRRSPWTSAGTMAPPAVRPEAPTTFSASVTALGYAAAARRAQTQAAPMHRALRAPIADAPSPGAKAASIGVTVGGRPASPLLARL